METPWENDSSYTPAGKRPHYTRIRIGLGCKQAKFMAKILVLFIGAE